VKKVSIEVRSMQVGQRFRKGAFDLGRNTISRVIWEGLGRILTRERGKPGGSLLQAAKETSGEVRVLCLNVNFLPLYIMLVLEDLQGLSHKIFPAFRSSIR
jgi:hypothetical protein